MEDEPLYEEASPEWVLGYREAQERARAGGQIMATEIEGHGRLARLQERIQMRQTESRAERQFLHAFFELRDRLNPDDEVFLKDKFLALPNANYKNPVVFLLAEWVLAQGLNKQTLRDAKALAMQIDNPDILEEDILRYCRLLSHD